MCSSLREDVVVLMLTRSQDGRTLYGGLYTNRTFEGFGAYALQNEEDEEKKTSEHTAIVSKTPLTDDDCIRLEQCFQDLEGLEKRFPSFLLKQTFEVGEDGDYDAPDGSSDDMEDKLKDIAETMKSIIAPVFSCLSMSDVLARCAGMHLVIVADADLVRLPLSVVMPSPSDFASVSLDFSVHMHQKRCSGAQGETAGVSYVVDPRGDDDSGILTIDDVKSMKSKKSKKGFAWDGIVDLRRKNRND